MSEILNRAGINAVLGAGSVVLNDYALNITPIERGYRLTVKRGSETQTMDILDGVGIVGIEKTGSTGDADSYRITFTDGSIFDYTVETNAAAHAAAEAARVEAENSRAGAEAARESAEAGRVNAEDARVKAEAARESAESARENAESARAQAEDGRQSAEAARVAAEQSRASAESVRTAAENARVAAETARANAENERAGAETLRSAAETDRATAESGRVIAEQGRASAESERVAAEEARATEFAGFSGEITQLKGDISELNVKNEVLITKDSSGNAYADYTVKGGHIYQFINASGVAVVARTVAEKTASASTIESITGGLNSGLTLIFTPSQDADYVRVYFSDTPSGNVQLFEYDTITQTVNNINATYGLIINQKVLSSGGNGRCSIFFPMVVGKSYRFTNLGGGSASIVAQTKASSSTVTETIASGTYSGDIVIFTPSQNASVVRIDADSATSILMEEIGTLYDSAKSPAKKPYQSGQIHFTVPVNQQRLHFTQGSTDTAQDNETDIVDVDCVLMLPASYSQSGAKTNLLMICHGSGGGVTSTTWFRDDATVLAFFQKFLDAGFAIFDCNGYKNGSEGQESWGVDTASIAYHKAYEYVVKNYNVTDEMCVYGFSMGGLNALNYCNMFPSGIKALGLGAPVVSLYNTVWVDQSVQAKGDVSRAYGFTVSGTYESDTVGNCDPYACIKNIDSINYYPQRLPTVKIWHGDSDTAVSYQYSQTLFNAIKNSGGFAYYRIVTGKGHEICYGGNANVANEIIMYFMRFVLS